MGVVATLFYIKISGPIKDVFGPYAHNSTVGAEASLEEDHPSTLIYIKPGTHPREIRQKIHDFVAVQSGMRQPIDADVGVNLGHQVGGASDIWLELDRMILPYVIWTAIKIADYHHDRGFQAGEFEVSTTQSIWTVIGKMQSRDFHARRITVPEGFSNKQIMARLNADDYLEGELDLSMLDKEGSYFPDTYFYHRGMKKSDILKRMKQDMQQKINELAKKYPKALKHFSKEELLVLASMVERETPQDDEKKLVASVMFNRLKAKMRLQSDPTIIYAMNGGDYGAVTRVLTEHLSIESPYNTYKIIGLPPAPICNPGMASLLAVFDPEKTGYYYFVSNGKGGHYFAKNYKQHQQNVRRYRQWQKENQTP